MMSNNSTMAAKEINLIMVYLGVGLIILSLLSSLTYQKYPVSKKPQENWTVSVTFIGQTIKAEVMPLKHETKASSEFPIYADYPFLGAVIPPVILYGIGSLVLIAVKYINKGSSFKKAVYVAMYGALSLVCLSLFFIKFDIVLIAWGAILTALCWVFVFANRFSLLIDKIESLSNINCSKIQLLHEDLKSHIGYTLTACLTLGLAVATMMTILWALKEKPFEERTYISIIIIFGFAYSYLGIAIWVVRHLWDATEKIYNKL